MRRVLVVLIGVVAAGMELGADVRTPFRFMTLDPGHFHAGLVQKEMYPDVSPTVDVYAPDGPDLDAHLKRVAAFNGRKDNPTSWVLEIHKGPDFLDRMLRERPGNVVVISGRNKGKIERIGRSVGAALHVLADKPWILTPAELPALDAALADADGKQVVAYDIMTERFEVTTILQRALVNDPAVYGDQLTGTPSDPAVYMESVHHLMKVVSGAPNIRPAWFFDTDEQGEGLNDIGTHLVDLVQWTLFPNQAIDYRTDVRVLSAYRWPTVIPEADFTRVTASSAFPASLAPHVKNGALEYFCNTYVTFAVKGIHAALNVPWDWEAPAGAGDTHYAVYKGSRAKVEVRQSKADNYRTEVYVVPNAAGDRAQVLTAVQARVGALQAQWPGIVVDQRHDTIHLSIPETFRVGHEAHFAQVTRNFLGYLRNRGTLPAWERPNMLAKYYVTTTGTELSHKSPMKVSPRTAP
jgi:predicted dehydrogenase